MSGVYVNTGTDTVCIPFEKAENSLGVCDMETISAVLKKEYNGITGDPYIMIEVPFSDIMLLDEAIRVTIEENSLYNMFDDMPVSLTAKVPLDLMQKFYEDMVLCDADWVSGRDIRLSKWLTEEYTLDETEGLLNWMEKQCKDFSIRDSIVDADKWIHTVNEYLNRERSSYDIEAVKNLLYDLSTLISENIEGMDEEAVPELFDSASNSLVQIDVLLSQLKTGKYPNAEELSDAVAKITDVMLEVTENAEPEFLEAIGIDRDDVLRRSKEHLRCECRNESVSRETTGETLKETEIDR